MKITKKSIYNLLFLIIIGLLLYPPTKTYFIRLISFSPSIIKSEKRDVLNDYNWSLKGLNTIDVDFNNLKNKVVFINFWATWCPPCIAEIPSIQELYNDYKDEVVFIFVSNEKREVINAFYKKHNYDLPTYNLGNSLPKIFQVNSIPTSFVINKKGEVVINKSGAADWNSSKFRSLLNELIK
ncbi:TlpA family protein disulfide reductase [Tenacibaculum sp. E3R01]|uniref:TlpA family protein disulfide reductase n=1 Tax=Tenacibaculum sp. E3R01 TaxID=2267227 RepID=UPI000DE89D74|nr:TlpA disulfide reductase family protein [Tenacibaculum sp. E3R01]RBW56331.1 TlpA family protein disulfide reductase [Tenacibaculum sp. E3R01]